MKKCDVTDNRKQTHGKTHREEAISTAKKHNAKNKHKKTKTIQIDAKTWKVIEIE